MTVITLPENFTFTEQEMRVAKNMAIQEVRDSIIQSQTPDVAHLLVNNNSVEVIFVDVVKIDRQSGYIGNVREKCYSKKRNVDPQYFELFKQGAKACSQHYPMHFIHNGITDSFNVAYIVAKGALFVVDWWTSPEGKLKIIKVA